MKSIYSDKNISGIIKTIETVLRKLNLEIISTDFNNLVIEAKKSGSFLSFGNTIFISIKKSKKSGVRVYVDSESSAPIQLIDWGTNEQIENEIIEHLKSLI